jgi:hypothetical protein
VLALHFHGNVRHQFGRHSPLSLNRGCKWPGRERRPRRGRTGTLAPPLWGGQSCLQPPFRRLSGKDWPPHSARYSKILGFLG